MGDPLVSVIMPVFNAGLVLNQAVASVLAQTLTDFELIIIDDSSTDGCTDFLRANVDVRIRHLRNDQNLGAANSRNRAISLARGQFVAVADADDLLLPYRLAVQTSMMKEHPELSVVSGAHRTFSESSRVPNHESTPLISHTGISLALRWGPSFAHGTVLARTKVLLAAGGYRRDFEPTEDYDLYSRLLSAGHRFGAVSEVVLLYRISPAGLSATQAKRSREAHLEISERVRRELPLPQARDLIRASRVEPLLGRGNPRVRYAKLLLRTAREAIEHRDGRTALGATVALVTVGPGALARLLSAAFRRRASRCLQRL